MKYFLILRFGLLRWQRAKRESNKSYELGAGRFGVILACGSRVLHDALLFIFALSERKNEQP